MSKKYLEKTGVTDAITKVLVGLYEESDRPPNAIDYIKKYLGAQIGSATEYDQMKKENEELKARTKELETTIGNLRRELSKRDGDDSEMF